VVSDPDGLVESIRNTVNKPSSPEKKEESSSKTIKNSSPTTDAEDSNSVPEKEPIRAEASKI